MSLSKVDIKKEAERIYERVCEHARYLYAHPEVGFELHETAAYVERVLGEVGVRYEKCGKCGIVGRIEGKTEGEGKHFLLRADMDALLGIDKENPNIAMHACGHHMHTAMLLGAAELLQNMREALCGTVTLMFQPAEEILEGAQDMIKDGLFDPHAPDGGMMIHILSGVELEVGKIVVSVGGVGAPGADFFRISVHGKGTHGALPQFGVDPILASAHILTALCEIGEREIGFSHPTALTVGKMHGGESANVIPEFAYLEGSLRSFDEDVRARIKTRIGEIAENTARAFRADAYVEYLGGCPSFLNDMHLAEQLYATFRNSFGDEKVTYSNELSWLALSGASEDFSYVSREIPTVMVAIGAGDSREGYCAPLHSKDVRFDERALLNGTLAYVAAAADFLAR